MKNFKEWLTKEGCFPNFYILSLIILLLWSIVVNVVLDHRLNAEKSKPPVILEKRILVSDAFNDCLSKGGKFLASNHWRDENVLVASCEVSEKTNY